MNYIEMQKRVGCKAILRANEFGVEVIIVDIKNSYGAIRYHVRPIAGEGSAWVSANRVQVIN